MLKLIECPRDAMQGLHDFIQTSDKAGYLNQLLKVGFNTLDFGSFVSPKAIPQMRDTAEVLAGAGFEPDPNQTAGHRRQPERRRSRLRNTRRSATWAFRCRFPKPFSSEIPTDPLPMPFRTCPDTGALPEAWQNPGCVSIHGLRKPLWRRLEPRYWWWSSPNGSMTAAGTNYFSFRYHWGGSNPENISSLFSELVPAFPHLEIWRAPAYQPRILGKKR